MRKGKNEMDNLIERLQRWRAVKVGNRPENEELAAALQVDIGDAQAEIILLRAEVADWHACVRSEDMLVSNEKFIMWDREALNRCWERYIENVAGI